MMSERDSHAISQRLAEGILTVLQDGAVTQVLIFQENNLLRSFIVQKWQRGKQLDNNVGFLITSLSLMCNSHSYQCGV